MKPEFGRVLTFSLVFLIFIQPLFSMSRSDKLYLRGYVSRHLRTTELINNSISFYGEGRVLFSETVIDEISGSVIRADIPFRATGRKMLINLKDEYTQPVVCTVIVD